MSYKRSHFNFVYQLESYIDFFSNSYFLKMEMGFSVVLSQGNNYYKGLV